MRVVVKDRFSGGGSGDDVVVIVRPGDTEINFASVNLSPECIASQLDCESTEAYYVPHASLEGLSAQFVAYVRPPHEQEDLEQNVLGGFVATTLGFAVDGGEVKGPILILGPQGRALDKHQQSYLLKKLKKKRK